MYRQQLTIDHINLPCTADHKGHGSYMMKSIWFTFTSSFCHRLHLIIIILIIIMTVFIWRWLSSHKPIPSAESPHTNQFPALTLLTQTNSQRWLSSHKPIHSAESPHTNQFPALTLLTQTNSQRWLSSHKPIHSADSLKCTTCTHTLCPPSRDHDPLIQTPIVDWLTGCCKSSKP